MEEKEGKQKRTKGKKGKKKEGRADGETGGGKEGRKDNMIDSDRLHDRLIPEVCDGKRRRKNERKGSVETGKKKKRKQAE